MTEHRSGARREERDNERGATVRSDGDAGPDRREDRRGGERREDRPRSSEGRPERGGAFRRATDDRRPAGRGPGGDGRRFERSVATDDTDQQPRPRAPELPEGLEEVQLDADVRRDLRALRKDVADLVARHLVAAGSLLEEDPERALEHARYARGRASRLAIVREAAGLTAYHAGEWAEAIAELRAARRMGGGPGHIAVMADAERALGRPERALDLARSPEARELDESDAIELLIVTSGARRDLGELDAAVVGLQVPELDPKSRQPWSARLFYAYADALLAAGRREESVRWFLHAADADDEEETDASERLAALGEPDDAEQADEPGAGESGAGAEGGQSAERDELAEPEQVAAAGETDSAALGGSAEPVDAAEPVAPGEPANVAEPVAPGGPAEVAEADAVRTGETGR